MTNPTSSPAAPPQHAARGGDAAGRCSSAAPRRTSDPVVFERFRRSLGHAWDGAAGTGAGGSAARDAVLLCVVVKAFLGVAGVIVVAGVAVVVVVVVGVYHGQ